MNEANRKFSLTEELYRYCWGDLNQFKVMGKKVKPEEVVDVSALIRACPPQRVYELAKIANQMRRDIIKMLSLAKSGHPGGSLSIVEIITILYWVAMNYELSNLCRSDRDHFILSKGHGVPALYAALHRLGVYENKDIETLRKINSPLQGHPDRCRTPGIEVSTGSLGQGLSVASGIAIACKMKMELEDVRVYCIIGDGEGQEGQIWEAAAYAAHRKLDNLYVFLDTNNLQIDGPLPKIKNMEPWEDKWMAFGWNVIAIDGHSFYQILAAIDWAKSSLNKPVMIISRTVKGKGIGFMENKVDWHGNAPSEEEAQLAYQDLDKIEDKIKRIFKDYETDIH